jgi:hypothetical protein
MNTTIVSNTDSFYQTTRMEPTPAQKAEMKKEKTVKYVPGGAGGGGRWVDKATGATLWWNTPASGSKKGEKVEMKQEEDLKVVEGEEEEKKPLDDGYMKGKGLMALVMSFQPSA